jgi:hypothetical protein
MSDTYNRFCFAASRIIHEEARLACVGICHNASGAPELPLLQAQRLIALAHKSVAKDRPFIREPPGKAKCFTRYSVSTGSRDGFWWRKCDREYFEPIAWN